jgi:hypothetical protein
MSCGESKPGLRRNPDDDVDRARKKAKACKKPGQYIGSCKGGPPNPAYAADGEAQHEAKKARHYVPRDTDSHRLE